MTRKNCTCQMCMDFSSKTGMSPAKCFCAECVKDMYCERCKISLAIGGVESIGSEIVCHSCYNIHHDQDVYSIIVIQFRGSKREEERFYEYARQLVVDSPAKEVKIRRADSGEVQWK